MDALSAAARRLDASATGRQLLDGLRAHGTRVAVLGDDEFTARYGVDAEGYSFGDQAIVLRESALADTTHGALLLAHEASHALDDSRTRRSVVTGTAVGVAHALFAAHDGGTVSDIVGAFTGGVHQHDAETEATAFRTQAAVARELGLSGAQLHAAAPLATTTNGGDASDEDLRAAVLAQPGYAGHYGTGVAGDAQPHPVLAKIDSALELAGAIAGTAPGIAATDAIARAIEDHAPAAVLDAARGVSDLLDGHADATAGNGDPGFKIGGG